MTDMADKFIVEVHLGTLATEMRKAYLQVQGEFMRRDFVEDRAIRANERWKGIRLVVSLLAYGPEAEGLPELITKELDKIQTRVIRQRGHRPPRTNDRAVRQMRDYWNSEFDGQVWGFLRDLTCGEVKM